MEMETKTENQSFTCSRYFGYLSQLSGEKETPDECLVCERLLECRRAKSDTAPRGKASETIVNEEVKQPVEESVVDTAKKEPEEVDEPEPKTVVIHKELSRNQFVVEDLGMLYTSWKGTVLIDYGTLSGWIDSSIGKIAEVDIQTDAGKKMRCKVMPSKDAGEGTIMIPDKIQLNLEVKKGELVRVEPIIVFEKENKKKRIARGLSDFLRK